MSSSRPAALDMYGMSKRFARTALDAYIQDDWPVYFLHAATSFELLVKAIVAVYDPALIADTRNRETFVNTVRVFKGETVDVSLSDIKTVTVSEAYRTASSLNAMMRPLKGSKLETLANVRNGVAHTGYLQKTDATEILSEWATFVGLLNESLGETPESFWGPHWELVSDYVSPTSAELRDAMRKIFAARREVQRIRENSFAGSFTMLQSLELSSMEYGDSITLEGQCPACRSTADLLFDRNANDAVSDFPIELNCRVCGLRLNATDLLALNDDGRSPLDITRYSDAIDLDRLRRTEDDAAYVECHWPETDPMPDDE